MLLVNHLYRFQSLMSLRDLKIHQSQYGRYHLHQHHLPCDNLDISIRGHHIIDLHTIS